MKFIKKILLKILGNDVYQLNSIEVEKMNKWLFDSYEAGGFKNYYTMRKKYLVSKMALGIEGKEMYETLGRLNELKALATNTKTAYTTFVKKKK